MRKRREGGEAQVRWNMHFGLRFSYVFDIFDIFSIFDEIQLEIISGGVKVNKRKRSTLSRLDHAKNMYKTKVNAEEKGKGKEREKEEGKRTRR